MAVVEELMPKIDGPDAPSAASLMARLVERTWANLKDAPPESVLTGPVARGDLGTVEAHLEALIQEKPHLIPLYAALSTEMTRVAVRGGQLRGEDAEELLRLLQSSLETSEDGSESSNPSH